MKQQKTYFTVGSVIGETVNFYTDNFLKLWLPFIIVQFPAEKIIGYFSSGSLNPFIYILILLNSLLSTSVSLYVIITALNLYKKSSSLFQDNFSGLKEIFIPYILLQLLVFLGIIGGSLLLVIPGIILMLRWSVSGISLLEEKTKIRESMKRSKMLTKGFKGQVFVVYILIAVIGLVIAFAFSVITGGVSGGFFGILTEISSVNTAPLKLTSILYSVINSLLAPLYPVLLIVMFFNLKKEKEGYAAEELADSFMEDDSDPAEQ